MVVHHFGARTYDFATWPGRYQLACWPTSGVCPAAQEISPSDTRYKEYVFVRGQNVCVGAWLDTQFGTVVAW